MTEEISTRSWGSRIKDAFIGIFAGILLIIGSFVLTFWNEGHGLHRAQSLIEAQRVLISVPDAPVDNKNNLRVVYFSGLATTKDILTDSFLGIKENAIGLTRTVEMYQWKEYTETKTESQMGGSEKTTKTYNYKKIWSQKLLDSSSFNDQAGHQNPAAMPVESQQQYAQTVTVGDFLLPQSLIGEISETSPVNLSKVNLSAIQKQINKPVHYVNNQLYGGADYQNPQIGDLRIKATAVLPQTVSIIGQQTGNTLQPYMAKAGQEVILLTSGQESPDQMIHDALVENRIITWILRLVSLLAMVAGFSLILKPLVVLADVLPLLGSIMGFGTGLIAFVCGFVLWSIATAIAWFAIRPLWSLGIILVAVVVSYLFIVRRRQTQALNKTTQPAEADIKDNPSK
ncbi:TPA: TMEM43 family protein [Legionella feeleii]